MFERNCKNGIIYYTSTLFDNLKIPHIFCTRHGGISSGCFDSLNASTARKDRDGFTDTKANVEENYRRALSVLEIEAENACAAKQVHSDGVIITDSSHKGHGILADFSEMPDADAIISEKSDETPKALCVKTADCVPILLKNMRTGGICAVHAGWRGTASDIVTKAAVKLSSGDISDIVAAIGPCIGRCCYQIGSEVYSAFELLFKSKVRDYDMNLLFTVMPTCSMGGSTYLDLALANRELLELAGVKKENIDVSGICTCCFSHNRDYPFFSHRASGGHSGTFISAIAHTI